MATKRRSPASATGSLGRPLPFPGNPPAIQKKSRAEIAERRAETAAKVREVAPLEFVNGGGTGSLESTSAEEAVTEVAAGSGFFAPAQFDHYSNLSLRPAAGYALPVVRRPGASRGHALGGGYLLRGRRTRAGCRSPAAGGPRVRKGRGRRRGPDPLVGGGRPGARDRRQRHLRHAKAESLRKVRAADPRIEWAMR